MRALTENLGWKLLSLLIASLLWYLLVGETEVATSMPILVQYRNIPSDLEITGDHLNRLFVKVRGPSARVSAESMSKMPLILDLVNVTGPGEQTFSVTERELGLPSGVKLVRVVPAQIRLTLERRGSRSFPVEVRFAGGPPPGYRIASQRVAPQSARVSGPEFHLGRLRSVITDPVDLSSTVGTAEFRVPIYVEDPQLRIDSVRSVSVSITLEKVP